MGRFKPNRAGYAALMGSPQVQAVIEGKADAVKAAADSALSDGGYRYEGHEVKEVEGKLARGRVVRTRTDQARYSEAKRKLWSRGGSRRRSASRASWRFPNPRPTRS